MTELYRINPGSDTNRDDNRKRMAELLKSQGIGFDYKRPTLIKHKSQSQIIHPDFTLHISSLIIDYFPHPEKEGEHERINHRLELYDENHLNSLAVFPPFFCCFGWQDHLLAGIESKLQNNIDQYRQHFDARAASPSASDAIGMVIDSTHRYYPRNYV
jgi:hypothetical protein